MWSLVSLAVLQIMGTVEPPPGVILFPGATPDGNGQGLILFMSNMIRTLQYHLSWLYLLEFRW
jgi:hypothetical protein